MLYTILCADDQETIVADEENSSRKLKEEYQRWRLTTSTYSKNGMSCGWCKL